MNILLAHKDPAQTNELADMIRQWGYNLDLTFIGEHINDIILRKNYELIMICIEYPVFLSFNVISDVKRIQPELKIITITSINSPDLESHLREMGIAYYLTKPFEQNELKTLLMYFSTHRDYN